jgi:hypothetical protein
MPAFVFNTSFYVSELHDLQWEQWLRMHMIPAVEETFPGLTFEIFEVVSVSAAGSSVYSVQWRCVDAEQTEAVDSCVADLLADLTKHFGEGVTHFSSVMKKL